LLILPPARSQHGRCHIGNPLIPAVQISRTPLFESKLAKGDVRQVQTVVGALMFSHPDLKADHEMVKDALKDLTRQSKGGMKLKGDAIVFLNGFDEVRRSVSAALGTTGSPRALGTFSGDPDDPGS
jgi:alkyl sulfatase BDS1-like metallo-beta-lactamase superfamily hydrolase